MIIVDPIHFSKFFSNSCRIVFFSLISVTVSKYNNLGGVIVFKSISNLDDSYSTSWLIVFKDGLFYSIVLSSFNTIGLIFLNLVLDKVSNDCL